MKVVAFDVGRVHFAVRAEEIKVGYIEPLIFELVNFEVEKTNQEFFELLTDYLDKFNWSDFDLILIEEQMSYLGNRGSAPNNLRIQQHLQSYFLIKYRKILVKIVPARAKYPKNISGEKPSVRKRWAVQRMKEIYHDRNDQRSLKVLFDAKTIEKADDLSDAGLLILVQARMTPELFPVVLEEI